ncbi:hypothetical protein H0H93_002433, partial [Arthromyces matolae]
LFPGRSDKQIFENNGEDREWAVDQIVTHSGAKKQAIFEILWKTGDKSWLPFGQISHLCALDKYLEAMGIKNISDLPEGSDSNVQHPTDFELSRCSSIATSLATLMDSSTTTILPEMPEYGYTADGTALKPTRSITGNKNSTTTAFSTCRLTEAAIRNDWIRDNKFLPAAFNDFAKLMNSDTNCCWGMCEWDLDNGKWKKVREQVSWSEIAVNYLEDNAIANLAQILDHFCDPVTQQFSMVMVERYAQAFLDAVPLYQEVLSLKAKIAALEEQLAGKRPKTIFYGSRGRIRCVTASSGHSVAGPSKLPSRSSSAESTGATCEGESIQGGEDLDAVSVDLVNKQRCTIVVVDSAKLEEAMAINDAHRKAFLEYDLVVVTSNDSFGKEPTLRHGVFNHRVPKPKDLSNFYKATNYGQSLLPWPPAYPLTADVQFHPSLAGMDYDKLVNHSDPNVRKLASFIPIVVDSSYRIALMQSHIYCDSLIKYYNAKAHLDLHQEAIKNNEAEGHT